MHTSAHPQAGQTVTLKVGDDDPFHLNGQEYVIEDWWDHLTGGSWMHANGNPACINYAMRSGFGGLPLDNEVVYARMATLDTWSTSAKLMDNYPIIRLGVPDEETWVGSYELGNLISVQFSDQDGQSFASAVTYNDAGPAEGHELTGLLLIQEGENDESNWIWLVAIDTGEFFWAIGGCDYTGWDCQSWLEWTPYAENAEQTSS